MTPQELKNSIFFRAFSGHLVDRMYGEGTASELLKGLKLHAIIVDESRPEIPEHWRWTLLIDVASILYGFPFNSEKFNEVHVGKPLIRIRDILAGKTNTYTDEWCPTQYKITAGDMLIGMDGNFQVGFWQSEDAWLNQRVCKITTNDDFLLQKYLFYYLPLVLKEINGTVSYSTVKHLSAKLLNGIVIPLPPLAEQKRIVAKIEELLPLIDRYEKAWGRLEEFNRRFPADMQKSLLQMAIQGKLVEQRPEEGTGEEVFNRLMPYHYKLKPCKDELDCSSMDFEIPPNWMLVELNQLFDFVDYRGKTPNKLVDGTADGVFLITSSNIKRAYMEYSRKEYISYEEYLSRQSRGITQKGDLLFTTEAPMGNAALCDMDECSCGQRIITLKEYAQGTVYPALYMYFVLSPQFQQQLLSNCTGTTAKGIKADKLKHLLLPLPPYAEQKRIVTRLEQLLPLCEKLKRE